MDTREEEGERREGRGEEGVEGVRKKLYPPSFSGLLSVRV